MKKTRIIVFLLILAVIMPSVLLSACGNAENEPANETSAASSEVTAVTTAWAKVPDNVTYEGEEFLILASGNVTYHDFTYEDTETVLNDAIFRRNSAIEEKYKISIETKEIFEFGSSYGSGPGYREIVKENAAGECLYDMAMIGTHDVCNLAVQGYLMDLNEVPYIDLESVWWDQKANEQLSMKGIMYYTTGAVSTIVDQFTFCILFNKAIAAEQGLDLYSTVKEGKWTVDKFGEIVLELGEDLNGDGLKDENDSYGALTWNDTTLGVINAAGEAIASLNNDSEVELTLMNERVSTMLSEYLDIAYTDHCFNIQTLDSTVRTTTRRQMFMNDQALFWLYNVGDDNACFRDSETFDYGFLPYFKLDETQEEYACHIQEGACNFLCVPTLVEDPEMSGIIIESLAAESYYTVRPAYFEKQLVGRYITDSESEDMLSIIFSTRIFDVGAFYQVGNYNTKLMSFFLQKQTDYTSTFERYRSTALVKIAEINDNIKSNVIG